MSQALICASMSSSVASAGKLKTRLLTLMLIPPPPGFSPSKN
jgi:hypothetical protein